MGWFLVLLTLSVTSPVVLLYRIICPGGPTSIFCTGCSSCFLFLLGGSSVSCSTLWSVSGCVPSAHSVLLQFLPSPWPAWVGLFWKLVLQLGLFSVGPFSVQDCRFLFFLFSRVSSFCLHWRVAIPSSLHSSRISSLSSRSPLFFGILSAPSRFWGPLCSSVLPLRILVRL